MNQPSNQPSPEGASVPNVIAGYKAREQKIADCMKAQGFEYVPTGLDQNPMAGGAILLRNSPNENLISDAERLAYEAALLGSASAPGCVQSTVSDEQPEPLDIDSYTAKLERAKAAPAVVQAEAKWSKCMAAQGVEVASPDARNALLREAALSSDDGSHTPAIAAMEDAALQCNDDYYDLFWQVFEEIENAE